MRPRFFVKNCEIGLKIRQFRQNVGLSQEKLAELVGVTPQQMQKYETARTRISTERIQVIASALQVHVSEFFCERADDLTLNDPERLLINRLRMVRDRRVHESLAVIIENLAGR